MADTFGVTLKEAEKKQSELRSICICPDCPTYTPCAKDADERLYCTGGKSPHCITESLGCICPTCPVTDMLELQNIEFCVLGSDAEQRHTQQPG